MKKSCLRLPQHRFSDFVVGSSEAETFLSGFVFQLTIFVLYEVGFYHINGWRVVMPESSIRGI